MRGLWNYVLPDEGAPGKPIIGILATIDTSRTTVDAIIEALTDRWGPPVVIGRGYDGELAFNEVARRETIWRDQDCGVAAKLTVSARVSPAPRSRRFEFVALELYSDVAIEERSEKLRERAREAVPP
jgi:hypothetical protein